MQSERQPRLQQAAKPERLDRRDRAEVMALDDPEADLDLEESCDDLASDHGGWAQG